MLATPEDDSNGPVEARRVEAVFQREAEILHLHFADQVIRTTEEHPFYVYAKGWVDAKYLKVGDYCKGHDGRWTMLADRLETGEREVVYNFRVADYHTYYVGKRSWGFSIWAHNADPDYEALKKKMEEAKKKGKIGESKSEAEAGSVRQGAHIGFGS